MSEIYTEPFTFKQLTVFRRGASAILDQMTNPDQPHDKHHQLVKLARAADHLIQLEWHTSLPHPQLSLELLWLAADYDPEVRSRIDRITHDELMGCWAFPLSTEMTDGRITRYPKSSSALLGVHGMAMHLIVYRSMFGIPGGIKIGEKMDHLCRVHACANPLHLDPVSHATNVRRGAVARPRQATLGVNLDLLNQ